MRQKKASSLYNIIKLDNIWVKIYKKQTINIYWVAYYVDPASASAINFKSYLTNYVTARYIDVPLVTHVC